MSVKAEEMSNYSRVHVEAYGAPTNSKTYARCGALKTLSKKQAEGDLKQSSCSEDFQQKNLKRNDIEDSQLNYAEGDLRRKEKDPQQHFAEVNVLQHQFAECWR